MRHWVVLEALAFCRRSAVRWLVVVWPALILLAAWSTEHVHRQIEGATNALKSDEIRHYEGLLQTARKLESGEIASDSLPWFQNPTNPLVAGLFRASGHHAVKPTSDFRWVAVGFADVRTPVYQVKMGRVTPPSAITLENPLNQALGRFDTAFLLVYLLPLLVIVLGYDLLSKDRSNGWLDLTRTYGQPLWALAIARGVIHGIFWWVLTMSALWLSAAWISRVQWPLFLSLGTAIALYLLVFLILTVVVNRSSRSPVRNGLNLVTGWLLFLVLIPSMANALLMAAHPPPQRSDDVAARRAAEVRAEWDVDSPAGTAGWQDYWLTEFQRRALTDSLHSVATSQINQSMDIRHRKARQLEWLSPALRFQSELLQIAGVSAAQYAAFDEDVAAFESRWTAHFLPAFLAQRLLTMEELARRPVFSPP